VDALVAAADELAKEWLLALIEVAPLAAATGVPVARLVADGPELCAVAALALADDEALRQLGQFDAGRVTGARDARAAVWAVDALREVAWRATLAELRDPSSEFVAALAGRWATIATTLTAAAMAAHEDGPPDVSGEVRARDARALKAAADPVDLVAGEVARARDERRPLALLLIEVDGIDRLLAAEAGGDVAVALRSAERALHEILGPGDDVVCRGGTGRLWAVLRGATPADARAAGARVSAAVEREATNRGVPLSVSVGVAHSRDGTEDAETLLRDAEDELLAAHAAGTRLNRS